MFQISESTNVVHFNVEGAKKTDVKVVGTFEDPWFCGRDVCEILEYSNIHQALQVNIQQKSKKSLKELSEEFGRKTITTSVLGSVNFKNMSYNDGKTVYINVKGLAALLQRGKTGSIEIKAAILQHPFIKKHITADFLIIPTKEETWIGAIIKCFPGHTIKRQYIVDGCKMKCFYRIDCYFEDLNIAVECDENNHNDRDPLYEKIRQDYIIQKLGCTFFRFNPDAKDFDIFREIGKLQSLVIDIIKKNTKIDFLTREIESLKLDK